MTEGIDKEARERLAENLHIWYLEACRELKSESFNPNAQEVYAELTEEQKFLDRYIAGKVMAAFAQSCVERPPREQELVKAINQAIDMTRGMRAKRWTLLRDFLSDALRKFCAGSGTVNGPETKQTGTTVSAAESMNTNHEEPSRNISDLPLSAFLTRTYNFSTQADQMEAMALGKEIFDKLHAERVMLLGELGKAKIRAEQAASPVERESKEPPFHGSLTLAAEIFVRRRWKGDLDAIPLGKIGEFMASFAEETHRNVLSESPVDRAVGERTDLKESIHRAAKRAVDELDAEPPHISPKPGEMKAIAMEIIERHMLREFSEKDIASRS